MINKPMLAATLEDITDIGGYPIFCTPKLDGIRCVIREGKALTRKFKPIPNLYIRKCLESQPIEGFDGEIVVKGAQFNNVNSAVMSKDGKPDFTYIVFDYYQNPSEGYNNRMKNLFGFIHKYDVRHIDCLFPTQVNNEAEFKALEEKYVNEGYEGIMIRSAMGPYKFGRSTLREGYLLKFKRFEDAEAIVLGTYEKLHNSNEATIDALGHSKRSSHLAGQIPAGTLGGFEVRDISTGVEFRIGTGEGLNNELRAQIWRNRSEYVGKIVKYRKQKSGEKDKPRFPTFIGFRDESDM